MLLPHLCTRVALLLACFAVASCAGMKLKDIEGLTGAQAPDSVRQAFEAAKDVNALVGTPEFEEERALGQNVSATLLGATAPVADARLQDYVNKVGLWVALQGSRSDIPWRFAVLDSDKINAFAAPGGYVYLTRGLLAQLQSEAELAGVLGHEITHVEKRHHLKALKKEAGFKLAGRVAPLVLGDKAQSTGISTEQLEQIGQAARAVYTRGLDKDDEFEADRAGAVLAARAGYDPYGLAQVLQTLDSLNPASSEMALMFKTHPNPADRLQRLDASLGAQLDRLGQRPDLAERFKANVKIRR